MAEAAPPAGSLLLPQSGRATQGPRGWRGQPEPTPPRLKGTWKPGGPRAGRGAGEAGATWDCRCHNQRALLRGSHRRLQRALGSQGLQHRPQPLPCHPQGPASALGRPPPRRHAQVLPGHSPGGQNVTGQRLGPWPDPTQGAAPPPLPGSAPAGPGLLLQACLPGLTRRPRDSTPRSDEIQAPSELDEPGSCADRPALEAPAAWGTDPVSEHRGWRQCPQASQRLGG